ncbi:MAG: LCP family protein [Acidimicrobiia bacterium]
MSSSPAHPRSRAPRTRAATAAFLDALFPGAGHWYLGYRERGRSMMLITGGALLLVLLIAAQGLGFALKLFVQPATLLIIYAANALFFLYRAWAATRAYQLASPRSGRWSPLAAGLAIAAGVSIVLPHAWLGYYDLVQYDLVTSVFASEDPQTAAETSGTSPPRDNGEVAPISIVTTTTEPPPLWEEGERLNVLLMGSDAGPGRRGIRTDTMIVVSVDPQTGYAALFSLPRNFVGIPVPEDWGIWDNDQFPELLNALYQYGNQNPGQFPPANDSGAYVMKEAFSELLGIPIHFYALVDLNGFVDLVNALGGVTIMVTQRVYDETYPHEDGSLEVVDIEPGTYHMDGHTALAYARIRRTTDDYNRMGRQRCVLEALIEQADPTTVALRFPAIAEAIKDNMTTDIPIGRLPSLIDIMPLVTTDEIVTVRFIPPDWHAGRTPDRYPIPDVEKIRNAVQVIMELPPAEAIEVLGLVDLDDACDAEEPAEETPPTTAVSQDA